MTNHRRPSAVLAVIAGTIASSAQVFLPAVADTMYIIECAGERFDSLGRSFIIIEGDTLHTSFLPDPFRMYHSGPLTKNDYAEAAAALNVEPATIRAVVEIETGSTRRGFHDEGKPVINFEQALFRRYAAKRGVNLSAHASSPALKPLNIAKYGNQQAAQQARLDAAMQIDSVAAIESTFWGMFQIGGFNWKLCGAQSHAEFVELMSRSEYDQLRLFTDYIHNTGLDRHLQTRSWAAFARIYNGPSYAARRYHTRLAEAYRRYSKEK